MVRGAVIFGGAVELLHDRQPDKVTGGGVIRLVAYHVFKPNVFPAYIIHQNVFGAFVGACDGGQLVFPFRGDPFAIVDMEHLEVTEHGQPFNDRLAVGAGDNVSVGVLLFTGQHLPEHDNF